MDIFKHERTKYDVPLDHLDYGYIEKCEDASELEKIVKILRSGREGRFPDLEDAAERKLEQVNPNSKALHKDTPVKSSKDLGPVEWKELSEDLKNWSSEIQDIEKKLSLAENGHIPKDVTGQDGDLPPVRGGDARISTTMKSPGTDPVKAKKTGGKKSGKRVKPRDYKEWDKVDIEAELQKLDGETEGKNVSAPKNVLRKPVQPEISRVVDASGLTEAEKYLKADREKDKGNEAFRAGDYDEALLYYCRSLSIISTVAAHNNRAQAYLKLKKWKEALADCNAVLRMDSLNLKGYLRRAVAYQGQRKFVLAQTDLEVVLEREPQNKQAKAVLQEVEKGLAQQKVKGRRIMIEEVSGSSSEDEADTTGEEGDQTQQPKMANGEPASCTADPVAAAATRVEIETNQTDGSGSKTDTGSMEVPPDVKEQSGSDVMSDPARDAVPDVCGPPRGGVNGTGAGTAGENDVIPEVTSDGGHKQDASEASNASIKGDESVSDMGEPQTGTSQHSTPVTEPATPADTVPPGDATTGAASPAISTVQPQVDLPPEVATLKDQGNELFRSGRYAEAISVYDSTLSKLGEDAGHAASRAVLYSNRAACRSKIGDCVGCVRDCDMALLLDPRAMKALLRRAMAQEQLEKYTQAYIDFRRVLLLDHSVDIANAGSTRCSQVLMRRDGPEWRKRLPPITLPSLGMHQPQEAARVHKAPTERSSSPKKPAATQSGASKISKEQLFEQHKAEGNALVQKGRYKEAIACYDKCVESCPGKAVAYSNRALCYLKLSQPANVLDDCNMALMLEPTNVKAIFRRAQAYKHLEQYKESVADVKTLLRLDPTNAAALKELPVVTGLHEQYTKQRAAAEKARHRIRIEEVNSSQVEERNTPSDSAVEEGSPVSSKGPCKTPKQQSTGQSYSGGVKCENATRHSAKIVTTAGVGGGGGGAGGTRSSPGRHPPARPTVSTPVLSKATPYEFLQAWAALKGSDLQQYASLLDQVKAGELAKVITNKLDGSMLVTMTKCMRLKIQNGEATEALQYLQSLTTVPRFQMVSMFMSDDEKSDVAAVFNDLNDKLTDDALKQQAGLVSNKFGF